MVLGSVCGSPPDLRGKRIDYRQLYERVRARGDAAEACCRELRKSNADAHKRAGSLDRSPDRYNEKREAVGEDLRIVRSTAMNASYLQSEVLRPDRSMADARVSSRMHRAVLVVVMTVEAEVPWTEADALWAGHQGKVSCEGYGIRSSLPRRIKIDTKTAFGRTLRY